MTTNHSKMLLIESPSYAMTTLRNLLQKYYNLETYPLQDTLSDEDGHILRVKVEPAIEEFNPIRFEENYIAKQLRKKGLRVLKVTVTLDEIEVRAAK